MKNKIVDLNNHLFAELERLGNENLTDEQIDMECKRASSVSSIASTIVQTAAIQLKSAELAYKAGALNVPLQNVLISIGGEGE